KKKPKPRAATPTAAVVQPSIPQANAPLEQLESSEDDGPIDPRDKAAVVADETARIQLDACMELEARRDYDRRVQEEMNDTYAFWSEAHELNRVLVPLSAVPCGAHVGFLSFPVYTFFFSDSNPRTMV